MTTEDKLATLIRSASPEQLQRMVAALWDGLTYVMPTNQTQEEWYTWLCKRTGVKA